MKIKDFFIASVYSPSSWNNCEKYGFAEIHKVSEASKEKFQFLDNQDWVKRGE